MPQHLRCSNLSYKACPLTGSTGTSFGPTRLQKPCPAIASTRRSLLHGLLSGVFVQPSFAADLKKTYDSAAPTYDLLDRGKVADVLGLTRLRRKLLVSAYGDVLEVAVGTGINLPLYSRGKVESYVGIDLSERMLTQAKGKPTSLRERPTLLQGNVENLPFRNGQFDAVVSTYSLCVFERPVAALREMRRVLKPGGMLLLLEHSRSFLAPLALYQDLTASAVAATSRGCVWNQDLPALFLDAKLRVLDAESALGGLITLAKLQPED